MSFANLRPAGGHRLCKQLRCKEMYYDSKDQLERAQANPAEALANKHYWCLKTFTAMGPENEPCHAESCKPERACYEA